MDLSNKNYYQILGVPKNASSNEIKEAYKELAKIFHPDSNYYSEIIDSSLDPKHIENFKLITQAYNTLIDPQKRKEYDELFLINLKDWDDYEELDNFEERFAKFQKASLSNFGKVSNDELGAIASLMPATTTKVRSVSEIMRMKRSFLGRVLGFLGFL